MFRFEDPIYLWLLVLIPILALVRFVSYRNQRKRLRKFGDPSLLKELMPDVSRFRPSVKFCVLLGALALLIVMLARPQMGTKISHEKRVGIETIIAMDISNSMLAEDIIPSRLDRSKMMVENLVDHFTNDKIGLIVFAGDAFVQLPITSDYVSAKMFLSSINPSMMATQGTDIARAIEMATHSFTQEEGIGKAIIVITDGEDHEGGALQAAEAAKDEGMRVYVLGVGSVNGAPIPISGSGDYMKDRAGNTVMSALNEEMCKQVAQAGGGAYIHVENNSAAQQQLDSELDKLAKKETSTTVYSEFDEQFQAVGILVLLLLILEICILDRRNPLLKNLSLFKRNVERGNENTHTHLILLMVISFSTFLFPLSTIAQTDRHYIRQGNKLFRSGDYPNAEVSYRKAIEKNPKNPQAAFNLGNALMAQKKDSAAVAQFESASKLETNPLRKAKAFHNMGVVCQSHKMYGEAIEAYKSALRLNPADDETRYNLVLCKHQQQKQQQNQQNQQGNDNKKQDDKKDQQKQDQQKDQQNDKKQQEQQKPQMSKDNAEQLLNAAIQNEKQTQDKLQKAQQQPQRRNIQKNW
jgi:Ca-activated chloride channel family protein